jgi:hypothetical protein
MKADVKSASAPAPQLHVPSWVPEPIAQRAKTDHAAAVDRVYEEALRQWQPLSSRLRTSRA